MFSKTDILKAAVKAAASKLPEGSAGRDAFERLSSVDVGVAAKELLVMGAGKGRSLVAEMAQKATDALSEQPQPEPKPAEEVKPAFTGTVHELIVWAHSHEVSVEEGIIKITSTDGLTQTRLVINSACGASLAIQDAINTRIHEIIMGREPK